MENFYCSAEDFVEAFEDIIKDGGSVPLIVTGRSMTPFLRDGEDTVRLCKCTPDDFKRGKILLFRRENGVVVLHRIKKVLPDGNLEMNGDAQYWCETIKKEQAIAAVSHVEHNGKIYACNSSGYKLKVAIWQSLKPIRPLIFKIRRKLNGK